MIKIQKTQTISRELALLTLSQLASTHQKALRMGGAEAKLTLEDLMFRAIDALREEVDLSLEAAGAELQRGNDRLLNSQTRASDVESARTMTQEAIELTQKAIERLEQALALPKSIAELGHMPEVRNYTLEILTKCAAEQTQIDTLLEESMVNWQLGRLPKLDRDILRIATTEMVYIHLDPKIAIDEAIELAKRYSDDRGRKFINGVLRRVTDRVRSDSVIK
jgi:transcription antitermination protein NusB